MAISLGCNSRIGSATADLPLLRFTLIAATVSVVLSVFLVNDPPNDVAFYYGRMVLQFADRNWAGAFHHMIPPLVPAMAGLIASVGVPAYMALKIVSGVFMLLSFYPLFRIVEHLYNRQWAQWACLLMLLCPRLLRYSTRGLLENAKVFFLLLLSWTMLMWPHWSWKRRSIVLGLGVAGLSLVRGEGVILAAGFVAFAILLSLKQPGQQRRQSLLALTTAILLALGLCLPWLCYEKQITGYWSLDSRQIYQAQAMLSRFGFAATPVSLYPEPVPGIEALIPEQRSNQLTWGRNLRQVWTGLFPPYALLAIIGIFRHRRQWCWIDTLFAGIIVGNAAIFASSGYITSRYIIPTVPFLLLWVLDGGTAALTLLKSQLARWLTPPQQQRIFGVVGTLVAAVCLFDGLNKLRPSWPLQPDAPRLIGNYIAEHRDQLQFNPAPPLTSGTWGTEYFTGKYPVLMGNAPAVAFWSDSDYVSLSSHHQYSYAALVETARRYNVDLLAITSKFLRRCPEFASANVHFAPLEIATTASELQVYRFYPEKIPPF